MTIFSTGNSISKLFDYSQELPLILLYTYIVTSAVVKVLKEIDKHCMFVKANSVQCKIIRFDCFVDEYHCGIKKN